MYQFVLGHVKSYIEPVLLMSSLVLFRYTEKELTNWSLYDPDPMEIAIPVSATRQHFVKRMSGE